MYRACYSPTRVVYFLLGSRAIFGRQDTRLGAPVRFGYASLADDRWLAGGMGMNRTHHVHFRVSAKEWAILQELAAADELAVSSVLRSLIRRANDGKTNGTATARASLERGTPTPFVNTTNRRQ